jgi:hypothetical protein
MTTKEQLAQAEALFKEAFSGPRDPRSDAYKRGVMAALVYRFAVLGVSKNCPYQPGTAEHDAFSAGCDEGHLIWRRHTAQDAQELEP